MYTPRKHISYFHCHYHSYSTLQFHSRLFHIVFIHQMERENVLIAAQFYFNYFIVWIAKVINFFEHFCVFATPIWVSYTSNIVKDMEYRPMRRLNALPHSHNRMYCNHINYTAIYSVVLRCVCIYEFCVDESVSVFIQLHHLS